MNKGIGVILTGGDFQGLGVLRTLASKDIPIILVDSEYCISKFSRFKKKFIKSPNPSDEKQYVAFLIQLAQKEQIKDWIIFPNSDITVYVLSKYKTVLEQYYTIPTPVWDIIHYVYIKKNTYTLAEKNGILIPKTYYPQCIEELLSYRLDFPVVLKPSIRDNFYSKTKNKAILIKNKDELIKTYRYASSIINPDEILIQDYIPGGPTQLFSFCPFFKDGKVITSITANRTRQHPMNFGHASTFASLVDIPVLEKIATKFLTLIRYYGIAEVEFMLDPRDGQFKLIEINPRVWGWHTLAIAAGADLPYLLYQDQTKQELVTHPVLKQLKWVRLTTDLPTVFIELLKKNIKIKDYIKSMEGKKEFAVFSLRDPLPFFAEIALLPYLWIKRGF